MIILASVTIFWVALTVCVYIYFGYPVLLLILSRVRPRRVVEGDVTPSVTFVIAAFNEQENIGRKLENTLTLDYPEDRIEVLVVSNGSTDRTEEIVRQWPDARVRLIALPAAGKVPALNEGARIAQGEVLVFSDADFFLDPQSLRILGRKFNDRSVGGVCGARRSDVHRDGDTTGDGEGLYGRWDKWQKIRESEIGSVFAADGLLYAIRRGLYAPVQDPAQADDIAISTQVVLQGYRLLFEPSATAWENASVQADAEFRRKIRVTHHSVRALLKLRWNLITRGFYSVELLSHKLIRHFIPFFMILMFLASIALTGLHQGRIYAAALAAQALVYGLALIGWMLRNVPAGRMRALYVPYYFCFVNAAAFFGILSIVRGHRVAAWSTRSEAVVK